MSDLLISGEFLGSDGPERVKKCRQLADEADRLANAAANSEMRGSYLDLKKHWTELADKFEQATNARPAI